MSADDDLIRLYSQRILALAAEAPLTERLAGPGSTAHRRAPLCGSTITIDLTVEDGRIIAFGQDLRACALGQASASVLARNVIGRSRAEIAAGRDALSAMLKSGGPPPAPPFHALEALLPARSYTNRHASILLAWDAALAAFDATPGLGDEATHSQSC